MARSGLERRSDPLRTRSLHFVLPAACGGTSARNPHSEALTHLDNTASTSRRPFLTTDKVWTLLPIDADRAFGARSRRGLGVEISHLDLRSL
jgi:hypothetical protein